MTDILQLPGWEPTRTRSDAGEYIIEAAYTVPADTCPKCGVIGRLYRHGTKTVAYRDSPIRGKPVVLEGTIQRYKCRECDETFVQQPAGVEGARRMTARCVEYIQDQCLRDTFTRLAEHVGCVEGTVRNIANEYVAKLNADYRPELPTWLGIDETMLNGEHRCVLTDVVNRRPIDILNDRKKATVKQWLWHFRDRTHLCGLAMDMWDDYRGAARFVFPNLPIVIDKFHVVRMANFAVQDVRIRLQQSEEKAVRVGWKRSALLLSKRTKRLTEKQRFNLDMWLANEPELGEAYRFKERLFDIYDMEKDQAISAYDDFLVSIPKSMKTEFHPLTRAMRNWRSEILAYFDYPITNGYTEALNGVAKVANRAGRGYGYDIIRARILFNQRPRKEDRCQCCGRVMPRQSLAVDHLLPVVRGERTKNGVLICADCHGRFHTGLNHADSTVST